jgi:phosphomannomutase
MIETGAMMGAEESGGYGFGMHLPERDGIYADLMLLDLFLREKARGVWPVSKAVAHFHEIAGASYYRRIDVHVERSEYDAVKRGSSSTSRPAARVARRSARGRTQVLSTNDGYKFFTADGSWLIVRASGTEPLVRVYTECTSAELRDAVVEAGERMVRG